MLRRLLQGGRGRLPVAVAVVAALCATAATSPADASGAQASPATCPWVGTSAPVATRVHELMARMTTAQKISMVHGLTSSTDTTLSGPVYAGDTAALPALCVPPLHLEDGPAGVGDGMTGVTQLPAPVALSAAWDPALAASYGEAIAAEQRGKGANVELGPTVNIVRDPRWGRAFESLGEDPYLAGQTAASEITGIQSTGVIAMVKHLAVYNQETARDTAPDDAVVSERAMQEIYLPAFDAAVTQGHAGAVMCSYNEVNGAPACQSAYLLEQALKRQFGFGGFVASDWFATKSAAVAANAGLDMQMPDGCYFGPVLQKEVAQGTVSMSRLDDMVGRVLGEMFSMGLFDRPAGGSPGALVTSPAHAALARQVAEDGTVLLKNAPAVLPLDASTLRSLAVIGSDAGRGAYSGGGGSAQVHAPSLVTPYQGIAHRAGPGAHVTYDDGTNPQSAAAAARSAQVAIVFASVPESEGQDLLTLDLPPGEDRLVEAVASANPHTVVVLNSGSAVAMPWLSEVPAVAEAWYPGQEDGNAIAAVLFGDVDPSGKLPVTFPAGLSQVPAHTPMQWPGTGEVQYSEGLDVGYRYYDTEGETPLFPFGFGLSYTTFGLSDARITSGPTASGQVSVEATITNTGRRAGSDVVQLYVRDPAVAHEPPAQLKDFAKISLQPGQSAPVRFTLGARDLSYWDTGTHRWVAAAGTYQLRLGDSSRDLPLSSSFRLPRTLLVGAPGSPPSANPSPTPSAASVNEGAMCPKDVIAPIGSGVLTVPSDAWSGTGQPLPF